MEHGSIMLFSLLGFLAIVHTSAGPPFWKDCGAKQNVLDVKVNDCTQKPCKLPRGHNATIEVKYTAEMDSKTSTSVVHGIIAGLAVPFPLPDKNGCHYTSPACPIVKGKVYTFKTELFVAPTYPSLTLLVKWEEQADDKETDLCCVIIPAIIQ